MADRLPHKPQRHGSPAAVFLNVGASKAAQSSDATGQHDPLDRSPTKPKRSCSPSGSSSPLRGIAAGGDRLATALSLQLREDPMPQALLPSLPLLGGASSHHQSDEDVVAVPSILSRPAASATALSSSAQFSVDLPLLGRLEPRVPTVAAHRAATADVSPPEDPIHRKVKAEDDGEHEVDMQERSTSPGDNVMDAALLGFRQRGEDSNNSDEDASTSMSRSLDEPNSRYRHNHRLSPASSSLQSFPMTQQRYLQPPLHTTSSQLHPPSVQQLHPWSTSMSHLDPSMLFIDVAPGVQLPLWGREETRQAMREGRCVPCECFNCHLSLVGLPDTGYVLCPDCSTISPMKKRIPITTTENTMTASSPSDGDEAPRSSSSSSASSSPKGVCVGIQRLDNDDDASQVEGDYVAREPEQQRGEEAFPPKQI